MALKNVKLFFLNGYKKFLREQNISSALCYNSNQFYSSNEQNGKLSKAVKSYMEKAQKYDTLIKEQIKEFELGKQHLANIMGKNHEMMTQKDIDEAINYLLPSGLFVPSARPSMKHPNEVFGKKQEMLFDITGRPFHFLFYTIKPSFSQILHDAACILRKLNNHEAGILRKNPHAKAPKPINIVASSLLSKEELEKRLSEKLFTSDYDKFVEVINCIIDHPYSNMAAEFLNNYLSPHKTSIIKLPVQPTTMDDGSQVINILGAKRKSSVADVKLKYPGTGLLTINGQELDYFHSIQCREQVIIRLIK